LATICFMLAGSAAIANAASVTLSAAKDNTLYQSDLGDLSNGAGPDFFVGRTANGLERRGLIAFDIAGAIPKLSVIDDATLTLHVSRTNAAGSDPIELHRVLADWGEGTSVAPGGGGTGAAATPDDATWLHRFFDNTFWTNPGGDFSPTGSASADVAGIGSYAWSGPGLVADVQDWLAAPSGNFGWLLLAGDVRARRFDSRENPDLTVRPSLSITYTVIPLPPAALPGLAMLLFSYTLTTRRAAPIGAEK
jgi:hypothetical protein